MSGKNLFKNIKINDLLKRIFSPLQLNICFKLIKYNKGLQNDLNINVKDSIFNYQYKISTKDEIIQNITNFYANNRYISQLSFPAKFCLFYSFSTIYTCFSGYFHIPCSAAFPLFFSTKNAQRYV
jgi:hypothetical protein